jgi:hypothetical protein
MPAAASGAEWIHFTYLGGAPSDDGTSQLLYEAQPTGPLNRAYPSAWRVDTDQSGNVIWAEMVYLFSTPLSDVAPVRLTSSGGDAAWPTVVAPFHPRLIAGLRSRVGPEAYYEVMLPTGSKDALFDGPFNATVFFAVDSDGNIRPGGWTYGDSTAWSNASPGTESADASTSPLRRTFAATLP